jgi:hypothetical protein
MKSSPECTQKPFWGQLLVLMAKQINKALRKQHSRVNVIRAWTVF